MENVLSSLNLADDITFRLDLFPISVIGILGDLWIRNCARKNV